MKSIGGSGAFSWMRPSARPVRHGTWFGVLLLVALMWVSPAFAAGTSSVEAIRQRMDQGQELFLAGKYEEAARVFEEGYQAHPYSAFLFNAGVCLQKVGQAEQALARFKLYLEKDPGAPDAPQVTARIQKLEAALAEAKAAAEAQPATDPNAPPTPTAPVTVADETNAAMKSLVVVETDPAGAPIQIFKRDDPKAAAFREGTPNSGWTLIAEQKAPADFTLDVGRYHIVVAKFGEYNRSETDIDVSPGHVHQFKANLSQGAFMAFLRVTSNVPGAYLFLDDAEGRRKVAWARAPYGELITPGKHVIEVEAPGFEPARAEFELMAGDQKELDMQLVRLGYGIVRIDSNVTEVTVSVDSKPGGTWRKGEVALELKLPAGQHELLVSSDGYKDLRTVVEVPRGQLLPMRANMIPRYPRGPAWAQAIIAAGLIGASTYFAVESDRLHDNVLRDRDAGALSAQDPRLNQGFWYSIGADAGFVLGGVFAGLSTYNFIKDPYPDSVLRKGKKAEFEDPKQELPSGVSPAPVAAPPAGGTR